MLEKFNQYYQPDVNNIVASNELISEYECKVPKSLIDIWKSTGLGNYNNGLIELVNPKAYGATLDTWIGKEPDNYIPFAITGFGELFYYRKLTDTDEDVCLIDIQFGRVETLVWSLTEFFEDFLTNESDRETWLRESLFLEAVSQQGKLDKDEVFTFVPILALGGMEESKYLQKANALVYQELVFQMTR